LQSSDAPAIDGIIKKADEVAGKSALDAALINAGQAAEHYEIARYGSLIAWTKLLGRNDCASVLQKTLDEEKATDKKLTALAESRSIFAPQADPYRRPKLETKRRADGFSATSCVRRTTG
jgi:ferritin-like metal-binding protein YciE